MIFFITAPVYHRFKEANDLDAAYNLIANGLVRAQFRSQSVENDSGWGVKIIGHQLIIFKGLNYGARDINYDEKINLPANISVSDLTEINFAKLTGYTNTTGTIILLNSANQSKGININEKGSIN